MVFYLPIPSSLFLNRKFSDSHLSAPSSRKIPWRLSSHQKRRQRKRLKCVDTVVATLDTALAKKGETSKAVERWKMEMPREEEMRPKDKYTVFDRKVRGYRKGIHSEFLDFPRFV